MTHGGNGLSLARVETGLGRGTKNEEALGPLATRLSSVIAGHSDWRVLVQC
jgi:hypothetical protein